MYKTENKQNAGKYEVENDYWSQTTAILQWLSKISANNMKSVPTEQVCTVYHYLLTCGENANDSTTQITTANKL